MPIDMNMLVFFLGKCVRTAAKNHGCGQKNQKARALLYLANTSSLLVAMDFEKAFDSVNWNSLKKPSENSTSDHPLLPGLLLFTRIYLAVS